MNLTQIEAEFDKDCFPPNSEFYKKIKQFYRQKITELLESTKLSEKTHWARDTYPDDKLQIIDEEIGFNQAVSDQQELIRKALL